MPKKIAFKILLVFLSITAVYGLIVTDLWLRARRSYLEAEKYMSWHLHPDQKRIAVEKEFQDFKEKLDKLFAKKRMSEKDYNERIELAQFDRDEKLRESSVKYAYIWYQTTVELFSPPENRWVRQAREKMLKTKELWKQELKANKIPFEDYMLE